MEFRELERVRPEEIEKRSFEIITQELGDKKLDPEQELVIKRVIHTTADFDYADQLIFSPHAVKFGIEALKEGIPVITDTNMGKAGINKKALERAGSSVHCFMADEDVAEDAKTGRPRELMPAWTRRPDYLRNVFLPLAMHPLPWFIFMS